MKDLGTVPVMAYALPNLVAFYPDGAWWMPVHHGTEHGLTSPSPTRWASATPSARCAPCSARSSTGRIFPARTCSSAASGRRATISPPSPSACRVWGIPSTGGRSRTAASRARTSRRSPCPAASPRPRAQVDFVRGQLSGYPHAVERAGGQELDDARLRAGIRHANRVRRVLARAAPARLYGHALPAAGAGDAHRRDAGHPLLLAIARNRLLVLEELLARSAPAGGRRTRACCRAEAARIFWVNPVADLRAMNLLEDCGGRLCGTEYLFCHALDAIPEDLPPLEALAQMALADPMVGPAADRAERICRESPTSAPRRSSSRASPAPAIARWKGRSSPRLSANAWASRCWNWKCRRCSTPCARRCKRAWRRWWRR